MVLGTPGMESMPHIFLDGKTVVEIGSQNQIARQKARDGEDLFKTGMNEESMGTLVPIRQIPKGCRLNPLVREGVGGRTRPPIDPINLTPKML